jgi:alpha-methylacyl-CoA racemase
MTGWGQSGPLASASGHDINYIALSGALFHGGQSDRPPAAPPTLVGDIGGGAMFLALGLVSAIFHARQTGQGQVIDAAITDGSALMTSLLYGLMNNGYWQNRRQSNALDGAAFWYDCYQCADGGWVSVGALEPQFYSLLIDLCGLGDEGLQDAQYDVARWPELKRLFENLFRTKTRDQWCQLLEGTDVCFAPVLNMPEAAAHAHNQARQTFVQVDGVTQPAPAPRFSATPARPPGPAPEPGTQSSELLEAAGFSAADIARLRAAGAI